MAKPFTDYTPEEFARVQQINVHGPFHLMQAALPHMTDRKYGKIINVASTAGKWGSINQSAYNASKHALVGLTRCVALETAKMGINVNAICPGLIDTDMIPQFMNEHSVISNVPPAAVKQELMKRVPIGRLIDPSECGHLAVYLASSESDGMTGQSILLMEACSSFEQKLGEKDERERNRAPTSLAAIGRESGNSHRRRLKRAGHW